MIFSVTSISIDFRLALGETNSETWNAREL